MIEKLMTNGTPFIVDDIDADLVEVNWYRSDDGYAYRNIGPKKKRKKTFLHRLILERVIGRKLELGEMSDHKDRNRQNNQRDNLRLATKADNMHNKSPQRDNKSGYKGVYYKKDGQRRRRWKAQIHIANKMHHLGYFHTPEEAAKIYDQAAIKFFGEFAYLNFMLL